MNEKKNPLQDRSLLVGLLALVVSLLSGILLFLHVPVLVCAILAIIGTLGGIASLLLGKGGALPAAVAIGTGLMCVLTLDRKSTRLNSSHYQQSRMPSSA